MYTDFFYEIATYVVECPVSVTFFARPSL